MRDRFPDGQLFVNLRGATPGVRALTPIEVLSRFLRALGVSSEDVPDELDRAAAAWRELLDGRRVLIVLDDAAGLAQIRPLLTLAPGNALLVTSRESFTAADDCAQVGLGTMSEAEAVTMLAKLVGAERTSRDPTATVRLTRLCDGLPLALRIAGARLADRPSWSVGALAERLEDERRRLHELEKGDRGVRSGLMTSWSSLRESADGLDRRAARTLAALGLLRVPDVGPEVVAALLGDSVPVAERALDRLVDAHLLDCAVPGRYHLHDLVRLFAAELTSPSDRNEALIRALSLYVATARSAGVLRDPHRVQPDGVTVVTAPLPLAGVEEANAWLTREEPNLLAASFQAMADPSEEIARLGAALAFALRWYQESLRRGADLISLNEHAQEVARRLDDERMGMQAIGHIGSGLRAMHRFAEAIIVTERQRDLCQRQGDRFGEQQALGNLASTYTLLDEDEEALHLARAQLKLAGEIRAAVGERYALIMIGLANQKLGRFDEASAALSEALDRALESGDRVHEGEVRIVLGNLYLDRGEPASALLHLRAGLACGRSRSARSIEIKCLIGTAQAARLVGAFDEALEHISEAVTLCRSIQNRHWEQQSLLEQAAILAARAPQAKLTLARLV